MTGEQWKPSIADGPWGDEPLGDRLHRKTGLPYTLTAGIGESAARHRVFDPALKQFDDAYRPLDPRIEDPAVRTAWLQARRTAMEVALHAVYDAGWASSLVLRGSMLMGQWFGPAAREPHDLDFVVVPADWRIEEDRTGRMLDEIAAAAERLAGGLDMPADEAASEYIWTYERVPGRRLVLPWYAPGLPGGQVQLDFVFNEPLPVAPEPVEVARVPLLGATRELSLAWKLMWLAGDLYPQGKDLYDAVLLAESCALPRELLEQVFRLSGEFEVAGMVPLSPATFDGFADTDWSGLRAEYPSLGIDEPGLARRLLAAVERVFADGGG